MRLAAFADTHGNVDALRAVLADIDAHEPDLIVNLGDHVSGPLAAAETLDLLMARPEIVTVRGNHDRWVCEQSPEEMGPSDAHARGQLSDAQMGWLRALPATVARADMVLCHATPGDDLTYWLDTITEAGEMTRRDRDGVAKLAEGIAAPLILCAHTHIPNAVRLPGGPLIVNPGSVGCPAYDDDHPVFHVMQTGSPDASWALIDTETGAVTFRRVPYDTARMVALAKAAGRKGWAEAIATGWLTP
ncbi:metallophosphoesterase family protein [Mesobacterium pallidum]|uniref:metallophosphoesterase family protein n=1 Tax=Mesobacterium pallidum TaxID=2872037 RepID=UPI001EE2BA01